MQTRRLTAPHAELTKTIQDYYRRAIDATEEAGRPVPVYQIFRGDAA
jgi:hypothetical protein